MATTNPTLKEIGEERQRRLAEERAARGESPDDEAQPMIAPKSDEEQKEKEEEELSPSENMRKAVARQQ